MPDNDSAPKRQGSWATIKTVAGFLPKPWMLALFTCLSALVLVIEPIHGYFTSEPEIPYLDGACRLWPGWLKFLWITAEVWLAISYCRIAAGIYQHRSILGVGQFHTISTVFAAFIYACGIGHLIAALMPLFGLFELLGVYTLLVTCTISHCAAEAVVSWFDEVGKRPDLQKRFELVEVATSVNTRIKDLRSTFAISLAGVAKKQARAEMMRAMVAPRTGRVVLMVEREDGTPPAFRFTGVEGETQEYEPNEMIGKTLAELYPGELEVLRPHYINATSGTPAIFIYRQRIEPGTLFHVAIMPVSDGKALVDAWPIPSTWTVPLDEVI